MKQNWDYNIDDLLSETRGLIDELEGQIADTATKETANDILKKMQRAELEQLIKDYGPPADGYAEIVISNDRMTVYADFYPPSPEGREIIQEKVEDLLKEKGVIYGIDWDALGESIRTCNIERTQVTDVVIARGSPPKSEEPEHFEIEDRFMADPQKKITGSQKEEDRIDFHKISHIILAKEEEQIAHLVPLTEGISGSDISGLEIPFKKETIKGYIPGKNISIEAGIARASCQGRFNLERNIFWIEEVLEIQSDVDYSTGNIDFPGDVIIRGQVKEGFSIASGGSLFCLSTLDATMVDCKKNLVIKQGIIGKNQGVIRCEGSVESRFIENCYLEAHGNVSVDLGIMNSVINSRGSLSMGKKGVLVGGKITAQDGIEVFQVGTTRGPKTELICGIDFVVKQKLEWIRDKNIEINQKIQFLDEKIKRSENGNTELQSIRDSLKEGILRLNESAMDLVSGLDRNQDAKILVQGTIYANTYIEICNISFIVSKNMEHVGFFLDPTTGRIQHASLSGIT